MDLVVSAGASLLAGIGDGSILDGVPIGSLPHVRPILPMSPWPLSESLNIGVRDLYMSFKDQNAYSLYVPHYIDDAGVLYQLTHLNCLLINIYHSFMEGGPYQPGYIEYINLLQQQLDSCSPSELPQKLASLIDAQYNERLYHFYDQWFTHILGSNNTPPHRIHIRRIYELWVRDWYFEHVNIPSPLDQFAIVPFYPLQIGKLYFSFTNASFFLLLILSFVLFLFHLVTQKGGGKLVGNACQSVLELIYDFVPNLVNEQIGGLSGNVKQKYFPCISVTFTFSLFRNLQGMIPYSFTVTSHFLVTLGLSFSLFIGITIVGFAKNGLHFLSFSLPAGVPLPLAPFLVLLELIPHCFRALSLGIRLFANMMAGHSLVKILSGFAWTMLCMNDLFYFIGSTGPFFIVLALTGLELGVAILQAYVFTILICIYLNDAINLH